MSPVPGPKKKYRSYPVGGESGYFASADEQAKGVKTVAIDRIAMKDSMSQYEPQIRERLAASFLKSKHYRYSANRLEREKIEAIVRVFQSPDIRSDERARIGIGLGADQVVVGGISLTGGGCNLSFSNYNLTGMYSTRAFSNYLPECPINQVLAEMQKVAYILADDRSRPEIRPPLGDGDVPLDILGKYEAMDSDKKAIYQAASKDGDATTLTPAEGQTVDPRAIIQVFSQYIFQDKDPEMDNRFRMLAVVRDAAIRLQKLPEAERPTNYLNTIDCYNHLLSYLSDIRNESHPFVRKCAIYGLGEVEGAAKRDGDKERLLYLLLSGMENDDSCRAMIIEVLGKLYGSELPMEFVRYILKVISPKYSDSELVKIRALAALFGKRRVSSYKQIVDEQYPLLRQIVLKDKSSESVKAAAIAAMGYLEKMENIKGAIVFLKAIYDKHPKDILGDVSAIVLECLGDPIPGYVSKGYLVEASATAVPVAVKKKVDNRLRRIFLEPPSLAESREETLLRYAIESVWKQVVAREPSVELPGDLRNEHLAVLLGDDYGEKGELSDLDARRIAMTLVGGAYLLTNELKTPPVALLGNALRAGDLVNLSPQDEVLVYQRLSKLYYSAVEFGLPDNPVMALKFGKYMLADLKSKSGKINIRLLMRILDPMTRVIYMDDKVGVKLGSIEGATFGPYSDLYREYERQCTLKYEDGSDGDAKSLCKKRLIFCGEELLSGGEARTFIKKGKCTDRMELEECFKSSVRMSEFYKSESLSDLYSCPD